MNKKAFTLIELLIGLAIFSVIIISIYSVFSIGVFSWDKIDKRLTKDQDVLILFSVLAKEIRNAISYGDNSLDGDNENLNFHSIKNISENNIDLNYIAQINYFVENGYLKKKEGLLKKDSEVIIVPLIKIDHLKFSYLIDKEWRDLYKDKKILPRAVKVDIAIKEDKYQKVIVIPTGYFKI